MSAPTHEETATTQTEQKSNSAEYNFAQLRKKAEEAELRARQAEERAAQLERETAARKSHLSDDDDSYDEPYVDQKFLKKRLEKVLSDVDQRIDRKAEEKARSFVEEERRNNYLKQNSDFNQVMQPDVIQRFAEKHPSIAEGFLALPESFERQKLLYESIKALGIHRKEEPKSIQDTIDKNRRGVFYRPSDVSSSPYSSGGNFTPSGMKDAYAKMQELKSKLRL